MRGDPFGPFQSRSLRSNFQPGDGRVNLLRVEPPSFPRKANDRYPPISHQLLYTLHAHTELLRHDIDLYQLPHKNTLSLTKWHSQLRLDNHARLLAWDQSYRFTSPSPRAVVESGRNDESIRLLNRRYFPPLLSVRWGYDGAVVLDQQSGGRMSQFHLQSCFILFGYEAVG